MGSDPRGRLSTRIEAHLGGRCLLLDSGTSALALAVKTAERARPGPVALPAWSCFDVATAAVGAGVRVVLYDLDPSTLAPEPTSLGVALSHGARTIVVAHLYGVPVPMTPVRERAREADALVVEDAAQALGAVTDLGPAGSVGDLSVLSFGRGKGLTGGAGGALLVRDPEARAMADELADGIASGGGGSGDWLRAALQWAIGRPSLYGIPRRLPFLHLGETRYHTPEPGRGISRAAARIVDASWSAAVAEAGTRRRHAGRLAAAARAGGRVVPVSAPAGTEPSWLRLPVLLAEDAPPGTIQALARLGIERGYPAPLGDLPDLVPLLCPAFASFPHAETLSSRLLTVPTHGGLTQRDLRRLESWLSAS